ncbi:hypothetical protein HF086_017910 [Spodoptera exigua]|uniref:Transporter n=1 Tax=Spodoptera exigua TaxID=7107 RepID=A0A922SFN6_SPOEX|nr:hypothetical protein HF086_017910 [Spodoptera exigua]
MALKTPTPGVGERETWGKKVDFLLSVIGFAVDLANVWRFPYLCYKNGGGAFLVPYCIMLVVGGIPLFYMELALGQFHRKGAITCWGRLVPLFKGIGYAVVLIAFYVDFYYNVIIAWALRFFFASFTTMLPWTNCDNEWNTPACRPFEAIWEASNKTRVRNNSSSGSIASPPTTPFTSAASEYFNRAILELQGSEGLHDLGAIKWDMALCLLAVVWFTALFPYAVLLILLVRGITLPGSATGIQYYLSPNFEAITQPQVWVDAATQVFFSLGPGFGVLLAYASYNKYHNNVYKDAILTSVINSATSFIAGFVIFSVLGYMAHASGRDVQDVATEGPGLVFVVYPAAIATMPGSTFWALIFFMMLLTLGLDSSGGFYFFQLLDRYAAGYSILVAVFFEAIAVSWIYGTERFCEDIRDMIGFRPGLYWRVCWRFAAPAFLLFITAYGLLDYEPLRYEDYVYPGWANALGWAIAGSSVMCIPTVAIYKLITAKGTFVERLRLLTTPYADTEGNGTVHNGVVVSESGGVRLASAVVTPTSPPPTTPPAAAPPPALV